ncbi:hypothetical protein [Streptomyces sp. NPDC053720]|uniref:hypothetical protein n=1 Tax=Streptomyces sp. NPDC053720 TaxID=3154855 RepID=UPI00343131FC
MNIIVAGQRIVTAQELVEVAMGYGPEPLDVVEELTAGGLASRDALADFLADFAVESDVDQEDADYYRALLRRMPRELRTRKVTAPTVEPTSDTFAEWMPADFESYEVLVDVHAPDPVAAVTQARADRRTTRTVLRLVRDEFQTEVAA